LGESYIAETKKWIGDTNPDDFVMKVNEWFEKGARLIGGCCRTGPDLISKLRSGLQQKLKRIDNRHG
jgi:homocysteine S-methyltransferase